MTNHINRCLATIEQFYIDGISQLAAIKIFDLYKQNKSNQQ